MSNVEMVKNAALGKFSEFSVDIKTELTNKLANNSTIAEYTQEYDAIQNMKSKFAEISGDSED